MSVQTQIDRISGAVSAALAALTEKGVTVPSGTKVDGLAALIDAIEAGGGSGGGSGVQTCTIKFDSKHNDTINVRPAVLSRYVDGGYTTKIFYGWSTEALKDVTVTDVVCGSAIVLANIENASSGAYTVIQTTSFNSKGNTIISGGIELVKADSSLKYLVFMAPTVPGATGVIGLVAN